tara:strand:- start:2210 stop:2455 length:246 start_codon:yes stop_codon:yes gene_type:complete
MDKIISIFKNIHSEILYVKDKIHYDLLLHIGIVIFTAVASAHAHSTYYEEGKFEGMNRFITIIIFIFFYSVGMLIEWAKNQ